MQVTGLQGNKSEKRSKSNLHSFYVADGDEFSLQSSDGGRSTLYRSGTQLKTRRSQLKVMRGGLMGTAALPQPTAMAGGDILDNLLPKFKKIDTSCQNKGKEGKIKQNWDFTIAAPPSEALGVPRGRDATLLLDPSAQVHEEEEEAAAKAAPAAAAPWAPSYPRPAPQDRAAAELALALADDPSPLGAARRGEGSPARAKRLPAPPPGARERAMPPPPRPEGVTVAFLNGFAAAAAANGRRSPGGGGGGPGGPGGGGGAADLFVKRGRSMDHRALAAGGAAFKALAGGFLPEAAEVAPGAVEDGALFLLCDARGLEGGPAAGGLGATLAGRGLLPALPSFCAAFGPGPLGLELEDDPAARAVVVRRCVEDSQADKIKNITEGCLLIGVGSSRIKSLADFEAAIKSRQKGRPFEVHFVHPSEIQNAMVPVLSDVEEVETDLEGEGDEEYFEESMEAKEVDDDYEEAKEGQSKEKHHIIQNGYGSSTSDIKEKVHRSYSSGSRSRVEEKMDDSKRTLEEGQIFSHQYSNDSSLETGEEEDTLGPQWNFTTGGGFVNEEDEAIAGRTKPKPQPELQEQKINLPLRLGCSLEDDQPIVILFSNNHLHRSMEVSWLDYEGARAVRRVLGPGEAYLEATYATHPWLARALCYDPEGNAIQETAEYLVLRLGAAAVSDLKAYSVLWQPGEETRTLSFIPQARVDVGNIRVPEIAEARDVSARARRARAQLLQQVRGLRRVGAAAAAGAGGGMGMGGGRPNLNVVLFGSEGGGGGGLGEALAEVRRERGLQLRR